MEAKKQVHAKKLDKKVLSVEKEVTMHLKKKLDSIKEQREKWQGKVEDVVSKKKQQERDWAALMKQDMAEREQWF